MCVLGFVMLVTALMGYAQEAAPGATPAPAATPVPGAADEGALTPAERQARLADGLFRRRQYRMAASEYEVLTQRFPEYERTPEAYLLWAQSYRRLDQDDKALDIYLQLLSRHPQHQAADQALVNAAEILLRQEAFARARELLEKASLEGKSPGTQEAIHFYLGQVYNQLGETEKALAQFAALKRDDFSAEFPYRPYAQMSSALIHRARREVPQATALLKGLAAAANAPADLRQEALYYLGELNFSNDEFKAAVDYYRELLGSYPASAYASRARINLGWSLLQLEEYREIIRLFEAEGASAASATGEELYLLASASKELNQYEAALETLRQLVRDYPGSEFSAHASAGMVECLYHLKRYQECVEEAEKLLAGESEHRRGREIMQFLGLSYQALEQWAKVAEVYEELLQRHWEELTEREDLLHILANAYERTGDPAKAAVTYRRILDLKEAGQPVEALLLAAENEMKAKQYEEAFNDYQRIVAGYPEHQQVPLALIGMAEVKMRMGSHAEAVEVLNRLLTEYPDHPFRSNALYLRGSLYFQLNRTKEAIADLARSLQEPNFAERDYARLVLGYALWEEGKEDEALQLFAEMLEQAAMAENFTPVMLREIGRKYLEKNNIKAAEQAFQLLARHPEPEHQMAGLIGQGKTAFQKGDFEKANELFQRVKKQAGFKSTEHVIALAYLGETYRQLGMLNRAEIEFQEGLKLGTTDVNANALLYTGLAKLNYAHGNLNDALRYATFAFVVFNDPQHTPEAMLLATRISADQDDVQEALLTYRELAERFPIALGKFKQDDANKALFEKLEAADRNLRQEKKP